MGAVETKVENVEQPKAKNTTKRKTTKKDAEVVTELDTAAGKTAEQETAGAAEKAAEVVTELDTPEEENQPEPEEVKRFCYMGPSLRKYGLIENMIYTGTASQLAALTKPAEGEYPKIGKLIFEAKEFEKIKKEKANGNNYVSRLYNEIKKNVRG